MPKTPNYTTNVKFHNISRIFPKSNHRKHIEIFTKNYKNAFKPNYNFSKNRTIHVLFDIKE